MTVRAKDNCIADAGTNGEFERVKISILHFEIPGEAGVMLKGLLLETGEVGSIGLSGQVARVEMMSPC